METKEKGKRKTRKSAISSVLLFILVAVMLAFSFVVNYRNETKTKIALRDLQIRVEANRVVANKAAVYLNVVQQLITVAKNKMTPRQITETAKVIVEMVDLYGDEGLTISLIFGMIERESNFNPKAKSKASAYGLMQVIRGTATGHLRRMGLDWSAGVLYDPTICIKVGVEELMKLHRIYIAEGLESKGNFKYSLHSYFWGERLTRMLITTKGRVDVPGLEYSEGVLELSRGWEAKMF